MGDKQVVLITGCSDGGLGSALALAFHKAGYRVIATARNLSKLTATRQLGIEEIELDVLSDSSLSEAVQKLQALTGNRLDILVNNAGEGYNMPVVDSDLDKVRKVFELNVFSIITVTHAFLPLLVATPGAKVVNNISVVGVINLPFQGTYNASKAAAKSYTENLRLELAPFDIKVIALMTGSVQSHFFDNLDKNHGQSTQSLPPDSIYRVLPGGLKILNDPDGTINKDGTEDAAVWAGNVVADLSRPKPPHQIWRGKNAGRIGWLQHLPVGSTDTMLKDLSGLRDVEKALERK